jgi:hypothetical protein
MSGKLLRIVLWVAAGIVFLLWLWRRRSRRAVFR